MEDTLKLILTELKSIKDGQARLEEKIDRIERKMTGIPESYEKLEEFVGRQQRVIEELSARSIEHRVEIKEMNRLIRNQ
ncbi:archaellum component FlaC [Bacillus fengqiuensis]|nr:archaellum component FlaC [Bacillus fengqiuensis]